MRIQFHGASAVDVPGHDDVQPGDVIEVSDEVGVSLLAAGTAYPEGGAPVPPASPLWRAPGKAKGDTAIKTAEAGKEVET